MTNLVVRNLHFTGAQPMGYATHFAGNQNMVVEECRWVDLPGVYSVAAHSPDRTSG